MDDLRLCIQVTKQALVHTLESLAGPKHLLVEECLLRPLDKIASMSLLAKHSCVKVFVLSSDAPLPSCILEGGTQRARRVFLMRSSLYNGRRLSSFLRSDDQTESCVVWVDRRLAIVDRELERNGVYGSVEQSSLILPLLPIETDLFSLEHPQSRGVDSFSVAHSLLQLQNLYGQFPFVYGVGEAAFNVNKMLKVLYSEKGEPRALADQPISHLFILDRNLDTASILLTGLTYESMLHDVFTIRCGKVQFGSEVEDKMKRVEKEIEGKEDGGSDGGGRSSRSIVPLDNNDGIFASVRNMHMTAVFPWLSAKAREIQASYDKGASLDVLSDVKAFVSGELRTLKSNHRQLETHICACEILLERSASGSASERLSLEHSIVNGEADLNEVLIFLQDSMLAEHNAWQVLSLACLASLANCGLPSKIYSSFRESFLHSYGYECLPVLHALSTRRLLFIKSSPLTKLAGDKSNQLLSTLPQSLPLQSKSPDGVPSLPFLIKRLGLVSSPQQGIVNLKSPDRLSYVFSGAFSPPLCTLISDTMVRGWSTCEMEKTFGKAFGETSTMTPIERRPDARMRKAIMAFFVGGVTYAEVAALRWLATQNNFRILIATTHIIHREKWLQCMGEVDETH